MREIGKAESDIQRVSLELASTFSRIEEIKINETEIESEIATLLESPQMKDAQALDHAVQEAWRCESEAEKAKSELGDKFDIREYHDELLRHGALPMDVLEKSVSEWIDVRKKAKVKKIKDRV